MTKIFSKVTENPHKNENISLTVYEQCENNRECVTKDDSLIQTLNKKADKTASPLDILTEKSIKIDEKFVVKITKETYKGINKESNCKILTFSSEWKFDEVIELINGLDGKKHPYLFIFIIKTRDLTTNESNKEEILSQIELLKENLPKFTGNRTLIVQLTSELENITKIFYKEENSKNFSEVHQNQEKTYKIKDFPSFLCSFLKEQDKNFEDEILEKLPLVPNSSLILRFLRILNLTEEFLGTLILKVAKSGTVADLLAILDTSFEDKIKFSSFESQEYLTSMICGEDLESEFSSVSSRNSTYLELPNIDPESPKSLNFSRNSSEEYPASDLTSYVSTCKCPSPSVLFAAVENKNQEVIEHLIASRSHLIQQLPLRHQIKVSTFAFDTDQFDVLCDLIGISDFPFPENFRIFENSFKHEKLSKIVEDRKKFHVAIAEKNFEEIDKFIDNNSSLKFIYSLDNNSALTQAIYSKKFAVFYYLKSLDFQGEDCESILKKLNKEERKQASQQAVEQRKINVRKALPNVHKSILQMSSKSFIHNRKISKETETKYRENIMKWYEDIYKEVPELLDVVASCKFLKVIFDFDSETVESSSLSGNCSQGTVYPVAKWIFIGAGLMDENGYQEIKGVLAHELCHYAMHLVYNNDENPYYKNAVKIKEIYTSVVMAVDKWSSEDFGDPDDECDQIISSLFTLYKSVNFHQELIVRVVQILVRYDNEKERSEMLQNKYKRLFDFWKNYVLPDLKKFLLKNKDVIKLNEATGLLSSFKDQNINFSSPKDIKAIIDSKVVIVTTNISKLLFINIYNFIFEEYGSLHDSQNFFTEPEKLHLIHVWNDFKEVCLQNTNLNVFVDCTKEISESLGNIFIDKEPNFIFVVSNESQYRELTKMFEEKKVNSKNMEVNYNWNDLSPESQKMLLQTKINFQNNLQFSFLDLLGDEIEATNENNQNFTQFSEIVDDKLLFLLFEKSQISVNTNFHIEKNFGLIFQPRKFIKKPKHPKRIARTDEEKYLESICNLRTLISGDKDQTSLTILADIFEKNIKSGKIAEKNIKISQEELLADIKNKKYVLISDIAGTGKSWIMKSLSNILKERNSKRWMTYIDLKQYIKELQGQEDNLEFLIFLIEKFLKPQNKFEAEILKKLYENGKVFIFFDGFDEIAPDCAEFVLKLAKNFESYGGNQMWIATRDYFEVSLQEELEVDAVYKLDVFTEEDGVKLITASWVLVDVKDKKKFNSRDDFEKFVKNSPIFEEYQQIALSMIKKVTMVWYLSIGLPQLFKMIADGFADNKHVGLDWKGTKIYQKFIQNLYERWSYEKGQLRKTASIESQSNELNFWKFHQFSAVNSLFPKISNLLFPDYDSSEWPEEEIVACGLMSKKGENFFFLHETFREYFIADFIAKALKKSKIKDEVLEIFVKILTNWEFGVFRIFLNDAIEDNSVLKKIKPKIQKYVEKFYEMKHFSEFFKENLENLADFVVEIFKNGNYEKVKNILYNSIEDTTANTKDSKMFLKFQEFLFEFLKIDDLKNLIESQKIYQKILDSNLEIEIFEHFITKTEAKIGVEFAQEMLKMSSKNLGRKILFRLFSVDKIDSQNISNSLKIIQKFLKIDEIFNLLRNCNSDGKSIFQVYVQKENHENFKILWLEIEKLFYKENLSRDFKELVIQRDKFNENILHCVRYCKNVEFYEILWELLVKLFQNREELKEFVLQKNSNSNNFVNCLVESNGNPKVIKFTFKILKETFATEQFKEILKSKGFLEKNILQSAACSSSFATSYRKLWKILEKSCESKEEFLEILKQVDLNGKNILHNSVQNSVELEFIGQNSSAELEFKEQNSSTFEFIVEELEKLAPQNDIRLLLSNLDKNNQNLLQTAVKTNNSSNFLEILFQNFRKYFKSSEIFDFMKHADENGRNILHIAAQRPSSDNFEFLMNELQEVASFDEITMQMSSLDTQKTNLLQTAAKDSNFFKFYEIFLKYFETSEIFEFIKHVDENGTNILHYAAQRPSGEVFEFIIDKLEKNQDWKNSKLPQNLHEIPQNLHAMPQNSHGLPQITINFDPNYQLPELSSLEKNESNKEIKNMLSILDKTNKNLLQLITKSIDSPRFYHKIWKIFHKYFNQSEIIKFIKHIDENGNNILHIAAQRSTGELFEFIIEELKKIASKDEIKCLLDAINKSRQNILQITVECSKSSTFHISLWKIFHCYFESSDIFRFITHVDGNGNNFLYYAARNPKGIEKLSLSEIKNYMSNAQIQGDPTAEILSMYNFENVIFDL